MLHKLECMIQSLINVKENQKQNKGTWTAEGRVSLRDFRGQVEVG